MKTLILLHPGFEEMEAVAPVDLLTRAEVEVVQAATGDSLRVLGRNGITIEATHLLDDVVNEDFDAVIVPGGPGIMKLRNDTRIVECLRRHHQQGKLLACICAAPLLLHDAGLLENIAYTAHPGTAKELTTARVESTVMDRRILTSRGAGTATQFALNIVRELCGDAVTAEIADAICWS